MVNIYYNPKLLLQATGFYWIWNLTFSIILIGLMISFVTEVFKLQKKAQPDFWGVVWKSIIIILLYRYLPSTLGSTIAYINGLAGTAELDTAFYKVFQVLSGDLNQVPREAVDGCVVEEITLWNATMGTVMAHLWNFIARFTLFIIVIITWVVKEMIFTWAWPTLMSLNMLGLCFALVVPAFPNQGFGSVGSFIKSVVTLMLWPILYTMFMFIIGNALQTSFANLEQTLLCPSSYEFSRATVIAMTGAIFMAYGIKSLPKIAESVINHKGLGQVGGGAAMVAGAMVVNAANRVSSARGMSTLAQGMSKAGGGLIEAGKNLRDGSGGAPVKPFTPPTPKGGMLQGGGKGYSMNQAQDLVSQVRAKDPQKGTELSKKLRQGANINTGRGANADKSAQNNAVDSVAKDAINFLGGDKEK